MFVGVLTPTTELMVAYNLKLLHMSPLYYVLFEYANRLLLKL